ncbi:Gfo/Idh/MocA family protein [Virgisporangium aurantiacum]|uniref:Oxidoreductase n=1 Tax=Virgisporangium aurantiacum TaxID=175570 RepID=A0A8J3Z245_9ACTN|nr:Gfo/Idh/MocA family oxidoreductase [Virgisporangium aurantiacum]GIJ55232.1 oxidoreductase [Virgisporangium aurantiacum]
MNSAAVALIGASGHGLWHRRLIERTPGLTLCALSDVRPPEPDPDAPLDGVAVFTDHTELLAATTPDAVVICTPPHTHLPIALDVLRAGRDLLLEKPPVASLVEHASLAAEAERAKLPVQVNFQALGSAALARLLAEIDAGSLGEIEAIGVAGTWWRPPTYWVRSPWSGKRLLDGRPVIDGALLNAFAHAVMQGLAIAAGAGWGEPADAEVERYRAGDIEVEDTGCLRLTFANGRRLTVAVTLAAREFRAGDITVTGTAGTAVLEYPTDRLRLPGAGWEKLPGREDLLLNLLTHRADPAVPLRAELDRTRAFTAVLEAVIAAPPPVPVDPRFLVTHDGGGHAVDGVEPAVAASAAAGALFSETAFPWTAGGTTYRHRLS